MCWMCDTSSKRLVAEGYSQTFSGLKYKHSTSLLDAASATGAVDGLSNANVTLLVGDDVADDITTTSTLQVGAPSIVSTINTLGDQDFFRIELVAGRSYEIGQFMTTSGPNGVPLADAFLEIYGPDGRLAAQEDGGGPNTPQGLDAMLTFTPKVSGTYYVNARAFDQDDTNGDKGDSVGDYELFARDVTGRVDTSYQPYYDIDSPLHSIDWGAQVDRTARNPDGQEGPRVTGNPYTGVGNHFGIEGKNVITVYYAKAGDVFLSQDPTNPGLTENIVAKGLQAWEKEAFENAFDLYEQVADLVFVEVQDRSQADFKIITYNGTPGAGASLLGRMNPPNEGNEGQAEFNSGDVRWSEDGLQQGGFYFTTLVHEFGHGLGMAHPHDDGGQSSVMRGGGGGTGGIGGGYGEFGLSQQVFTVMSYNKGWSLSPYGTPKSGGITGTDVEHFGWAGTLGALDIAVIQDKYGVNEEWATGNDTYTLKDVNQQGTFYQTIWDSGGTDEIVYDGAKDANIDLRGATLKYEEGGGGFMSYAYGIHGGYTIANSVTIENAKSGAGDDKLTGNDVANILDAGAGDDILIGGGGKDRLIGGEGRDSITGGEGWDIFVFDDVLDSTRDAFDTITDFVRAREKIDLSGLDAKIGTAADDAFTFIGKHAFSGAAGELRYEKDATGTFVQADVDGDKIADFQLYLQNAPYVAAADFIL